VKFIVITVRNISNTVLLQLFFTIVSLKNLIAGALNMLPKTMLRNNIVNPSTEEAIKIYQADKNYLNFYRNFLIIFLSDFSENFRIISKQVGR
jgi:hypothetical protein